MTKNSCYPFSPRAILGGTLMMIAAVMSSCTKQDLGLPTVVGKLIVSKSKDVSVGTETSNSNILKKEDKINIVTKIKINILVESKSNYYSFI